MSYPLPHPLRATVIGIDPGSMNLGLGAIQFDCDTLAITAVYTQTFDGSRLPSHDHIGEVHGAMVQRLEAHRENLIRLFNEMRPVGFACESPFYSQRTPSAFGVLTQVVGTIRSALFWHSPWQELTMVDPPRVKNAVGAKGGSGKDPVREAILAIPELNLPGGQNLSWCDEHEIDALAVAYFRFLEFRAAFEGRV